MALSGIAKTAKLDIPEMYFKRLHVTTRVDGGYMRCTFDWKGGDGGDLNSSSMNIKFDAMVTAKQHRVDGETNGGRRDSIRVGKVVGRRSNIRIQKW
ncbi:hypothetical protein DM860_004576 [Cuscuta australis]|uniref:Uncharacterized protein n=1 Tax=Cuscuta australis TaxID=267555 RepID=A0A328E7T8_9ASTE|nr:hypothetical protein DM860_004576 [Cuscuta australis]